MDPNGKGGDQRFQVLNLFLHLQDDDCGPRMDHRYGEGGDGDGEEDKKRCAVVETV